MGGSADFCKGERMGVVLRLLLGPDGQTIAVPVQDLDAIATLVDEDKEMTREGVKRRLPDARAARPSKLLRMSAGCLAR